MSCRLLLCQNSRFLAAAICLSTIVVLTLTWQFQESMRLAGRPSRAASNLSSANATLGFQRILAVSRDPSWRTKGLQAAAALAEIDITIPSQPFISSEIAQFFETIGKSEGVSTPSKHGSTLAWLAHLDMLKHVVMSGYTTALILEDDVDFDIRVRVQLQRLSNALNKLLNSPETAVGPGVTLSLDWDVIWLGHCGEKAEGDAFIDYVDDTRVSTSGFRGFSKKLWMDQIPEHHRRIQPAVQPICTFAYAVTLGGAEKILQFAGSGRDEAYDVALQHHCTAQRLRCFTVTPQLMQHYEPADGSGYVSLINEESGFGKSPSDEELEKKMGKTGNVVQSARCKALFDAQCISTGTDKEYWGY